MMLVHFLATGLHNVGLLRWKGMDRIRSRRPLGPGSAKLHSSLQAMGKKELCCSHVSSVKLTMIFVMVTEQAESARPLRDTPGCCMHSHYVM